MASFRKLEDIEVFNIARQQAKVVWKDIQDGLYKKNYELIKQIDAASGSVMDNIAEGFGRGSRFEFIYFLSVARGSNEEVKSQLLRAFDRGYYSEKDHQRYLQANRNLSVKISNLMSYLNTSDIKGNKWKDRLEEPGHVYENSSMKPEELNRIEIPNEFYAKNSMNNYFHTDAE